MIDYKKLILNDFTKEQLLGLFMELSLDYDDNEGSGTDLLNITPESAQKFYDNITLKLPGYKHHRVGKYACNMIRRSDSFSEEEWLHDKFDFEEFGGVYYNNYFDIGNDEVVTRDGYLFKIMGKINGHWQYKRMATEKDLEFCVEKLESEGVK